MGTDGRKGEHVRKTAGGVRLCVRERERVRVRVRVCVRVSLSVSLQHVGMTCRYVVCLIPGLLEEVWGGETGKGKRREGGATPSPAPGWLNSIGPSGRGPGGLAGAESDPCRLGEGNGGEGRSRTGERGRGEGRGRAVPQ
jgi:hypothetical protein